MSSILDLEVIFFFWKIPQFFQNPLLLFEIFIFNIALNNVFLSY